MLQRFGYRQLMYYVVSTALRGPSVGWGRQERKATVQAADDDGEMPPPGTPLPAEPIRRTPCRA